MGTGDETSNGELEAARRSSSSPRRERAASRLMRALFGARLDVYAIRWTNTRTGKAGYSPTVLSGWHGSKKSSRTTSPSPTK